MGQSYWPPKTNGSINWKMTIIVGPWVPDCLTQRHLIGSMASLTDIDVGHGFWRPEMCSWCCEFDVLVSKTGLIRPLPGCSYNLIGYFCSWLQNISKLGASTLSRFFFSWWIIQYHIRFLSCGLSLVSSPKTSASRTLSKSRELFHFLGIHAKSGGWASHLASDQWDICNLCLSQLPLGHHTIRKKWTTH
jgi:hypothetical protein